MANYRYTKWYIAIVLVILGLSLVGNASAASSPRFYLQKGWTTTRVVNLFELRINRTEGMTDADCWFSNGTAKTGFRKFSCVFMTTVVFPVKVRVMYVPVGPGEYRQAIYIPGKDKPNVSFSKTNGSSGIVIR